MLENYQKKDRFDIYLSNLLELKPQKFKEFYQKIDQTDGGKIFKYQEFHLFRYLNEIITPFPQVAINLIRDMSSYTPSKFGVSMMLVFCNKFHPDITPYVVSQCARTLNIILMNVAYEDLCD